MTRSPEQIEAVANRNAEFLAQLRLQAIEALISGDWDEFYQFLNVARGVTNPPRLRRVSLQEFLEKYPCNPTTEGQGADEMDTPSALTNLSNPNES